MDAKYTEYINRIFKWSAYRNIQKQIKRDEMDPNLKEMRRIASHFGDP